MEMIFVSVALYRSIFISSYLEQLAWFDSLANSSLLIRSLVFFAELSFAGLFMFAMLRVSQDLGLYSSEKKHFIDVIISRAPKFLFFCIFIAQFLLMNETKNLNQWGGIGFVIWYTGYFSICVWIVLFLMRAPRVLSSKDAVHSNDQPTGETVGA